jgi:arsenite methyltransferase
MKGGNVMSLSNLRLKMLNRRASAPGSKLGEVIESLNIQESDTVADIGSGGGYFTLEFAKRVGKSGKVYAVDTKQENLDYVKAQSEREGINNVVTVLADDEIGLPEKSVDLVFMRNVVHHLPEPARYFADLKRFLKPDSRVAIIDYKKGGGFSFTQLFGHYIEEAVLLDEMERAGYDAMARFDFLPEQSFNIFKPRVRSG